MRHRLFSVLCLCTAILCCGGCNDSTQSESEPPAIIGQLELPDGLQFTVPDGFSAQSSDMYEEYYVKDDASIIITEEPLEAGYDTAKAYADRAIEQYTAATDTFTLLANAPLDRTDADGRTLEFSYTISVSDHTFSFCSLTGYLLTEDTAYIITCKAKEETFAAYKPAFETCISGAKPVESEEETT